VQELPDARRIPLEACALPPEVAGRTFAQVLGEPSFVLDFLMQNSEGKVVGSAVPSGSHAEERVADPPL
jgi:hypothetical protein